jgi:hypothetical protein
MKSMTDKIPIPCHISFSGWHFRNFDAILTEGIQNKSPALFSDLESAERICFHSWESTNRLSGMEGMAVKRLAFSSSGNAGILDSEIGGFYWEWAMRDGLLE